MEPGSWSRKPCRVALRLDTGDPYFFFWALSRSDAAVDVGCSLPREAYGVRGYRAANASVGTVTRREISLHARGRVLVAPRSVSSVLGPPGETRSTAMPVGFWRSASKKALGRLRNTSAASGKVKNPLFRAT